MHSIVQNIAAVELYTQKLCKRKKEGFSECVQLTQAIDCRKKRKKMLSSGTVHYTSRDDT
jgi:hypothetical protein